MKTSSAELRSTISRELAAHQGLLSAAGLRAFDEYDDAVLLESVLPDRTDARSFVFVDAVDVIRAHRVAEVIPALVRAQVCLERGYYVAGYVAYESAPAFLPVPARDPYDGPTHLVWLGVYDTPIVAQRSGTNVPRVERDQELTVGQVEPEINRNRFRRALGRIRSYLERGHTYQVNYTFPIEGRFDGSAIDLYARLRTSQPVPYSSFVRHNETAVVSLSPELFFTTDGRSIILRPMKGTAPRGRTTAEDAVRSRELDRSEKDRAENLMIVDLLRNDVGKLAIAGTVDVRDFFSIEKYGTLFQATSTITAALPRPTAIVDILRALFPCGSVTGAPKIETMRIINELENEPRGVYTGAIGYAGPDGAASFSVAIRTLIANEDEGKFRLHVGSGVTIGSQSENEYDECLLKARFVTRPPVTFDLFETILWRPDKGYWLLPDHLRRLADSSEYFGREFSRRLVLEVLDAEHRRCRRIANVPLRVRLVLTSAGEARIDSAPLEPLPEVLRVGISSKAITSTDPFIYHKTTLREVHDAAIELALRRGWFDGILLNELGYVAEGGRSNVVIRTGNSWRTPMLFDGVLPGVMRSTLLRSKSKPLIEAHLTPADLAAADEVYVCNALRGLLRVHFVGGR